MDAVPQSSNAPQQGSPSTPRRTSWRVRLAALLGVTLITLLLAEAALQVFYRATVGQWLFTRTGLPLFVPDERFVYWNKPNLSLTHKTNEFQSQIYTNGQGLRVPEGHGDYPLEKPAGTERVLLLGPSFAFGWGVNYEETFAARLEALLNEQRAAQNQRIEVIDAGVPSMGPGMNLDWFRAVGKDFHPDLVVQIIYMTMTVSRVGNRNDLLIDSHGYLTQRNLSFKRHVAGYAKRSALVFYGWMAMVRARGAMTRPSEGGAILGGGREAKVEGTFDPDSPQVAESLAYYRELQETVESSGAKLLIVYVPLSYCVHPEDIARWSHLGVGNVQGQIAYDAAFCDYLSAHGYDCLNTSAAHRDAASAGQRLYYLIDIHWTPAGNDVAARAVAEHLRSEGSAP